jgi:hypothetical protein
VLVLRLPADRGDGAIVLVDDTTRRCLPLVPGTRTVRGKADQDKHKHKDKHKDNDTHLERYLVTAGPEGPHWAIVLTDRVTPGEHAAFRRLLQRHTVFQERPAEHAVARHGSRLRGAVRGAGASVGRGISALATRFTARRHDRSSTSSSSRSRRRSGSSSSPRSRRRGTASAQSQRRAPTLTTRTQQASAVRAPPPPSPRAVIAAREMRERSGAVVALTDLAVTRVTDLAARAVLASWNATGQRALDARGGGGLTSSNSNLNSRSRSNSNSSSSLSSPSRRRLRRRRALEASAGRNARGLGRAAATAATEASLTAEALFDAFDHVFVGVGAAAVAVAGRVGGERSGRVARDVVATAGHAKSLAEIVGPARSKVGAAASVAGQVSRRRR